MRSIMGGDYVIWEPHEVAAMADRALRAEVALWRDVHATGNTRERRHAAAQILVLLPELRRRSWSWVPRRRGREDF